MRFRGLSKYILHSYVPGFAGYFYYYGTRVYFPPRAQVFKAVCRSGIFEPDVVRVLTAVISDGVLFDVGANIGLMAIPPLHTNRALQVYSFEPSPNSLSFLRKTVEESEFTNRWSVIPKALSKEVGQADMAIGNPEDAMFESIAGRQPIKGRRVVRVPVSTLDAEWHELGRPHVQAIKIDTEGAEALILAGGHEMLTECKPAIVLEWCCDYLAAFGTSPRCILDFCSTYNYYLFSLPNQTPIRTSQDLRAQMISCTNFLLLA
jgi:FkbM family methyltransferase